LSKPEPFLVSQSDKLEKFTHFVHRHEVDKLIKENLNKNLGNPSVTNIGSSSFSCPFSSEHDFRMQTGDEALQLLPLSQFSLSL